KPGEVRVWDADLGTEIFLLRGHTQSVTSVAFSPNGKRIVSGSAYMDPLRRISGELKIWDADTGTETRTLKGHTQGVTSVAFSPNGRRVVGGGGTLMARIPGE